MIVHFDSAEDTLKLVRESCTHAHTQLLLLVILSLVVTVQLSYLFPVSAVIFS